MNSPIRMSAKLAVLLLGVAACSSCDFGKSANSSSSRAGQPQSEKLVDVQGVSDPVTCSADHVNLDGEAVVLGVVVDGKARAYLQEALEIPRGTVITPGVDNDNMKLLARHVVNDRLNGVPISVTYCDDTACRRVFISRDQASLALRVAGARGDHMLLRHAGVTFQQDAADIPLKEHPFEKALWREWRMRYPDTDIYLGHLQPDLCRAE